MGDATFLQTITHTVLDRVERASRVLSGLEGFENQVAPKEPVNITTGAIVAVFLYGFLVFLYFCITIAQPFASARLSYCYNIYIGNGDYAWPWSILCFFTGGLYNVYYSLFINPLCSMKKSGNITKTVSDMFGFK